MLTGILIGSLIAVLAWHEWRLWHHRGVINTNANLDTSNMEVIREALLTLDRRTYHIRERIDALRNKAIECDLELAREQDKFIKELKTLRGDIGKVTGSAIKADFILGKSLDDLRGQVRALAVAMEQHITEQDVSDRLVMQALNQSVEAHKAGLNESAAILGTLTILGERIDKIEQTAVFAEDITLSADDEVVDPDFAPLEEGPAVDESLLDQQSPGIEVRPMEGCVPGVNEFAPSCVNCLIENGLDQSISLDVRAQEDRERAWTENTPIAGANPQTIIVDAVGAGDNQVCV